MQSRPELSVVAMDNHLGGRLATQHLLDQGCRTIGHISGPLSWWEARQRKAGWEAALQESGLRPQTHHWIEGNWSSSSGEEAMARLGEGYPEIDAVFVANDQMALGVLAYAHRHGLRVPQDLAVVGFDGIPEAAYFWPPLTTVHQDLYQLGRTAVARLVKMIEINQEGGQYPQPGTISLAPELIVRASSNKEPSPD
jgi:LacI family transcriptional regulator